jgi:hypothetical protein
MALIHDTLGELYQASDVHIVEQVRAIPFVYFY